VGVPTLALHAALRFDYERGGPDLGNSLSVSNGIGSFQKGDLRTQSQGCITRTRFGDRRKPAHRSPRACHWRGRGFVYLSPALRLRENGLA
jgi:hypothetical protein